MKMRRVFLPLAVVAAAQVPFPVLAQSTTEERDRGFLAGLIEDAEKLATWYNSRVAARCDSPLVQAAQEAGAVVANVTAADWVPPLKNKAELTTWVAKRGWSKATISDVLQGAGYASSAAYLQADGNSVQGLAELLMAQLNW